MEAVAIGRTFSGSLGSPADYMPGFAAVDDATDYMATTASMSSSTVRHWPRLAVRALRHGLGLLGLRATRQHLERCHHDLGLPVALTPLSSLTIRPFQQHALRWCPEGMLD